MQHDSSSTASRGMYPTVHRYKISRWDKKTFSSNAFLLKAQEGEEHAMTMVAYINSTI
jgi:hypothetical protein